MGSANLKPVEHVVALARDAAPPVRPAYRADIDGLRALAVLAVIGYHARITALGGGFVGVDVFFVISGYLITQLLLANARLAPRAQLREFYLRRARRILPALLAVSFIVTAVACWLLLPLDLTRYAMYLGATPLLLGNIVAWLNGSYFEASLTPVALNHLWSIAVEEQFYLLYPALLLLIARYLPQRRLAALSLLALASLALCIWGAYFKPVASYYFASMRAWELLLGALVALCAAQLMRACGTLIAELLCAAGLAAVLAACLLYRATPAYPGYLALLPCLGTALVLLAAHGRRTAVSRMLAVRPLAFVGLISYSLYLWHWPVLTLAGYFNIEALDLRATALSLAAIFLLAGASYRFIEQPLRSKRMLGSNRGFISAAIGANLLLLVLAIVLWRGGGFPQRFTGEVYELAATRVPMHPDALRCMTLGAQRIRAAQLCRFGPADPGVPRIVVWGDSHALALLPAFEQLAFAHRVQVHFAAAAACGPLLGVADRRRHRVGQMNCNDFNAAALEAIRKIAPQRVILGGYWSYVSSGIEPAEAGMSGQGATLLQEGLERTLARIGAPQHSVCVVLDVPTLRQNAPYAMAMQARRGIRADLIGVTRAQALGEYQQIEQQIRALEARGMLRTADPKSILCASGRCEFAEGGKPLYRDSNHLSIAGARKVTPALEPCFADLPSSAP